MKVLVCVEALGEGTPPALALLERLEFPEERQTLACVVAPVASAAWHLTPLLGDTEAERRERVSVSQAEKRLESLAPEAKYRILVGHATQALLAEAERSGAELVVANASNRATLEAIFTGSVARSLVVGASQSVLLARPSEKSGPLHAVFATDHSDYAERCVETLATLAPRGLAKLTVLTACPDRFTANMAAEMLEAAHGVVQSAAARNLQLIERLSGKVGTPQTVFESAVLPGEPRGVLSQFMSESGADLLILGAKGHGLVERLALGSVSFDQAIGAHPWSALVLRV